MSDLKNTIYLFYDWKSCHLSDHIYLFFTIYLLKSCQVNNRDVCFKISCFATFQIWFFVLRFEVSNLNLRNEYFNMICDDSHHEVWVLTQALLKKKIYISMYMKIQASFLYLDEVVKKKQGKKSKWLAIFHSLCALSEVRMFCWCNPINLRLLF